MAPASAHPPNVEFLEHDEHRAVNVPAEAYYGSNAQTRSRTYSHVRAFISPQLLHFTHTSLLTQSQVDSHHPKRPPLFQSDSHLRPRRMSHDEKSSAPRRFLIDVEETIRVVLEQEDTDGDFQISITDAGPKMMALGTATSNGYKNFDIRVRVRPVRGAGADLGVCGALTVGLVGHVYAVEPPAGAGAGEGP